MISNYIIDALKERRAILPDAEPLDKHSVLGLYGGPVIVVGDDRAAFQWGVYDSATSDNTVILEGSTGNLRAISVYSDGRLVQVDQRPLVEKQPITDINIPGEVVYATSAAFVNSLEGLLS
jgi:hypothetical protein